MTYKYLILFFSFVFSSAFSYPYSFIKKILPEKPVILDCGAHVGNSSTTLLHHFPKATIIAVEADPDFFKLLKLKAEKNPAIFSFNYALGSYDGEIEFHQAGENSKYTTIGSVFSRTDWLAGDYHKDTPIIVPCLTLDTFCTLFNIPVIDFMHLDMEGSELGMLKKSPEMLSKVKVIITEVLFRELYHDAPLYPEIKSFLEKNGFVQKALYKRNEKWGDAIFIRR